ncbi:hypothetical protein CMEL01_15350 [Colletotrichum melonis]|uniref:C2H2-type domain-containing protein n=1 Tax=Colletotrichum melonis TaxID=1209925 RepID=A0AAI9UII5_9PEZI|nr:hypothetical protein CMEL01_15350 [Colletotrichum melonis]
MSSPNPRPAPQLDIFIKNTNSVQDRLISASPVVSKAKKSSIVSTDSSTECNHHRYDFNSFSTNVLSEQFNQLRINEAHGSGISPAIPEQAADSGQVQQEPDVRLEHLESRRVPVASYSESRDAFSQQSDDARHLSFTEELPGSSGSQGWETFIGERHDFASFNDSVDLAYDQTSWPLAVGPTQSFPIGKDDENPDEAPEEFGRSQTQPNEFVQQASRPKDSSLPRPSSLETPPATRLSLRRLKFACPYLKFNPAVYAETLACTRFYPSTHRLKEHLYKHHEQKPNCPRCREDFSSQADFMKHSQLQEPCKLVRGVSIEGFDKHQLERLKSRKRPLGGRSEEESWKNIYLILFPDCTVVPDPFFGIQRDDGVLPHSDLEKTFAQSDTSSLSEKFFSRLEEIAGVSFDSAKRRAISGLVQTFTQKKVAETNPANGPQHQENASTAPNLAIISSSLDKTSAAGYAEGLTSSNLQDASVMPLVPETGTGRVDDPLGIASSLAVFDPIHEYECTRALLDDQVYASAPGKEGDLGCIEECHNQLDSNPANEYLNMTTVHQEDKHTIHG